MKQRWGRRGAALAYVIVISMVLLILSTVLFTSAGYNLALSSKSTDGRQTYLTARSALEYAKGEIYRRAGDKNSTIALGQPTGNDFYIEKNDANSFSSESLLPAEEKNRAAHCAFTLVQSVKTVTRKTVVWIDDVKITEYKDNSGNSLWSPADKEQTQTTTTKYTNGVVSGIETVPPIFKLFPSDIVPAGQSVKVEVATDENTKHTYDAAVEAAVEYQGSDRQKNLAYHCTVVPGYTEKHNSSVNTRPGGTTGGEGAWTVVGSVFGDTQLVVDSYSSPNVALVDDVESDYPIVLQKPFQIENSNEDDYGMEAPQIYFMGTENGNAITSYQAAYTLIAELIYFNGNLRAQDYRTGLGDNGNGHGELILETQNGKQGVLYFSRDCTITLEGNGGDPDGWVNGRTVHIPKGYYYFESGTDLFSLNDDPAAPNYKFGSDALTPAAEAEIKKSHEKLLLATKTFVENMWEDMASGDKWQNNGGSQWSYEGNVSFPALPSYKVLREAEPAIAWKPPGQHFNSNNSSGSPDMFYDKSVFWYINDLSQWGKVLNGAKTTTPDSNVAEVGYQVDFRNVKNVYQAEGIYLQYVPEDEESDFVVPAYKTVVLKANLVSIHTQREDGKDNNGVSRPALTHRDVGGSYSSLILESAGGSPKLTAVFPSHIKVEYTAPGGEKAGYDISAGSYEVDSGLDLFSEKAEEFFKHNKPGGEGGGGEGGGGEGEGGETITPLPDTEQHASFTGGSYEN